MRRALEIAAVAGVLTVAALATGSPVFLAPAVLLALAEALALVTTAWAARSLRIEAHSEQRALRRGDALTLTVTVSHRCLLPIAPLLLTVEGLPGTEPFDVRLDETRRGRSTFALTLDAPHVGVSHPGISAATVSDLFGLREKSVPVGLPEEDTVVLPATFRVEPLRFAPVEATAGAMARATEDITDPADTRAWQPGDALKKVHWKLTARKRELMVRRFEEPVPHEALLMLDCAAAGGQAASIRDALCETAASVIENELRAEHRLCVPLNDQQPGDIAALAAMPFALERLARCAMTGRERLDSVIRREANRVRQTGAVVVVTARLTERAVEALLQLRRLGPTLRLYLIAAEENPRWYPMIRRLQLGGAEVTVIPAEGDTAQEAPES